ncbi:unnamed protein product, partial [Prorocentrum cordatum]
PFCVVHQPLPQAYGRPAAPAPRSCWGPASPSRSAPVSVPAGGSTTPTNAGAETIAPAVGAVRLVGRTNGGAEQRFPPRRRRTTRRRARRRARRRGTRGAMRRRGE